MMRVLVSLALAMAVYPVFVFVSLEPSVLAWAWEARGFLVLATLFVGIMAYTFPGWDD